MREHEVPTHVQAEDKVLLWLTFPQVVAIVAVAAIGYRVYSYAPGPSGLRIGLAAVVSQQFSVRPTSEDLYPYRNIYTLKHTRI